MAGNGESTANTNKPVKSWKSIGVCEPILQAVKGLGFRHPTQIQELTIPAAIGKRLDIIGAAETGSGKTLAFAIPIIDGILKDERKEKQKKKKKNRPTKKIISPVHSEDMKIEGDDSESNDEGIEEEDGENNDEGIEEEDGESNDEGIQEEYGENEEYIEPTDFTRYENVEFIGDNFSLGATSKPLKALILTPTRELAIQIKKHMDSILIKTNIKAAVVIGGMSVQKQERLLRKGPQIVIGTPGRLFQLMNDGNPHLGQLSSIKYLAIDETDRMLEKGHFEELHKLLTIINENDSTAKSKRQTFIFSATLSLVNEFDRKRINQQDKTIKETGVQKIKKLMQMIGVRDKVKIVDVTTEQATAKKLTESKIFCSKNDKELYLYYFIKTYPGRTLIFCNSINCVRRLQNLFHLLECNPKALHSSKNQKQRLKSLEDFTSRGDAILLATDVAARGLDIPQVKYIIHYEVPRTTEFYVHRSGRTARATEEGLSLMLVEPREISLSQKICKTLNKVTDFASFPINQFRLQKMKEVIKLGKEIESTEHLTRSILSNDNWMKKMSIEADLPWESEDDDENKLMEQRTKKRKRHDIQAMRQKLKLLIRPQVSDKFKNYSFRHGVLYQESNDIFTNKNALSELHPKKKKYKK